MMTVITTGQAHRSERYNLVRHFIEMVLAMMVGMAVGGVVVQAVCDALGHSGFFLHHVGLRAALMAMNMTLGMAVWMRYRRHGWAPIAEMGAAMFVPLALLYVPFWSGLLSGDGLLLWMHVLMLPAMVMAMLHRREEYARDHHHHDTAHSSPASRVVGDKRG